MTYKFIKSGLFMLIAAFVAVFVSPQLGIVLGGVLLVAEAVLFVAYRELKNTRLCILGAAVGFLLVSVNLLINYYPAQALCGQKANITGTVTEVFAGNGRPYYTVKTDSIDLNGAPQNVTLKLFGFAEVSLAPYDKISLDVSFAENASSSKEDFLTDRTSGVSLYAYMSSGVSVIGKENNTLGYYIYALRSGLAEIISYSFSDWQIPFTKQLLLGIKGGLDTEITDAFRGAGMSHILAVSGMHLAVIIGAVQSVLNLLFGEKSRAWYFTLILSALTVIYMAVAGFGMSILRAGFMLLTALLAKLVRSSSASIDNLGVAIIAVLFIDPMACCDVGFLMSVTSTAAIVLFANPLFNFLCRIFFVGRQKSLLGAVLTSFSVSFSAWLATVPVSSFAFETVSLAAPISNIGASFLAEYALIFSALAVLCKAVTPLATFAEGFAYLASAAENGLYAVAKLFAEIPLFRLDPEQSWIYIWILGSVCLFVYPFVLKKGFTFIRYSAVLSVFLFLSGALCQMLLFSDTAGIRVISLDEGMALLCSKDDSAVLITTGLSSKDEYKIYGKVFSPDIAVCIDSENEAAELSVVRRIKPKLALLSKDDATSRYYYASRLKNGTLSFWDGAELNILSPDAFTLDTGDGLLLYLSDEIDPYEIEPEFRKADIIIFDGVSPDKFPSLRCKHAIIRNSQAVGIADEITVLEEGETSFRLRSGNVRKAFGY